MHGLFNKKNKKCKRTADQSINTYRRKSANSHTRDTTQPPFQSTTQVPNKHAQTSGQGRPLRGDRIPVWARTEREDDVKGVRIELVHVA